MADQKARENTEAVGAGAQGLSGRTSVTGRARALSTAKLGVPRRTFTAEAGVGWLVPALGFDRSNRVAGDGIE